MICGNGSSGYILDYEEFVKETGGKLDDVRIYSHDFDIIRVDLRLLVFKRFKNDHHFRNIDDFIRAVIQQRYDGRFLSSSIVTELANNLTVIDMFKKNESIRKSPFHESIAGTVPILAHIDGVVYLTYERYEGDISKIVLSEQHILVLVETLMTTIVHLHGQGLYHLDIKLQNILVDNSQNFVISDYGSLSTVRVENPERGTRPYMIPLIDMKKHKYIEEAKKLSINCEESLKTLQSYVNMRKIQNDILLAILEDEIPVCSLDLFKLSFDKKICEILSYISSKEISNKKEYYCQYLVDAIQRLFLQKNDLHAIGIVLKTLLRRNNICSERWDVFANKLTDGDIARDFYETKDACEYFNIEFLSKQDIQ